MSFSSRLHHVALRGCVALGLYLASGLPVFAQAVSGDTTSQPRPEQTQDQPKPDQPPLSLEAIQRAVERIGTALEAQNDKEASERKDKHEAEDLKAQWEQAKWAEWMVYVGWGGLVLTLIGLAMIFGTLRYTKEAAFAAKAMVIEGEKATAAALTAAQEAKRQADLFEQSFVRLERPYLYIFGVNAFQYGRGNKARVRYTVANYGKTPATITIVAAGISFFEEPLDPLITDYRDDPEHTLIARPVLPPEDIREPLYIESPDGVEFRLEVRPDGEGRETVPVLSGNDQAFVWIRIQYRGAFGDGYITSACWRYDRLTYRLVQWGEGDYNQMT